MPELPEVETVRLQLLDKVVGRTIKDVEVLADKCAGSDSAMEEKLVGKSISHIDRVGKLMIFSFKDDKELFLLSHLRMTGQFFFVDEGEIIGGGHSVSAADVRELPGRHTRVIFYFTDGSTLYYNDMRMFGYVKPATRAEVVKAKASYGPEPLAEDFDLDWFYTELHKRKTSIKAVLLDQKFISGLGNIYVDEVLWMTKIRPDRVAASISKKESTALHTASKEILEKSILAGGTTFQNFADTKGESGNFKKHLMVFGKQGQKCSRCGGIIEKTRVAGRGTHFCPKCQK